MSRMTLSLFGALRPSDGRTEGHDADAALADTRERLVGLTPVELAAVEAMARPATGLTTR